MEKSQRSIGSRYPEKNQNKSNINTSNAPKKIELDSIIGEIGSLMEKFANEINTKKEKNIEEESYQEDSQEEEELKNSIEKQNKTKVIFKEEENLFESNETFFKEESESDNEYLISQPKGEVTVTNLRGYTSNTENNDYFNKEQNLKKLKEKKIKKMREAHLKKEIGDKWKINENSKKIIEEKLQHEKPLHERTKDLMEMKKKYLEINSQINEIREENMLRRNKTKWNSGHMDQKKFDDFLEKQILWEEMRKRNLSLKKEVIEKVNNDAAKYTYKPCIDEKSKKLVEQKANNYSCKKVYDRLFDLNYEMKFKKEEASKEKPSFTPVIYGKKPKFNKMNIPKPEKNNRNNEKVSKKYPTNNGEQKFTQKNNSMTNRENSFNLETENFSNFIFKYDEKNEKNFKCNSYAKIKRKGSKQISQEKPLIKKKWENMGNNIQSKIAGNRNSSNSKNLYYDKNKDEREFDIDKMGFNSDMNNKNIGNIFKQEKDKEEINQDYEKGKNERDLVYNKMCYYNPKEKKTFLDEMPIHKFSVPIANMNSNNKTSYYPVITDERIRNTSKESPENFRKFYKKEEEYDHKIEQIKNPNFNSNKSKDKNNLYSDYEKMITREYPTSSNNYNLKTDDSKKENDRLYKNMINSPSAKKNSELKINKNNSLEKCRNNSVRKIHSANKINDNKGLEKKNISEKKAIKFIPISKKPNSLRENLINKENVNEIQNYSQNENNNFGKIKKFLSERSTLNNSNKNEEIFNPTPKEESDKMKRFFEKEGKIETIKQLHNHNINIPSIIVICEEENPQKIDKEENIKSEILPCEENKNKIVQNSEENVSKRISDDIKKQQKNAQMPSKRWSTESLKSVGNDYSSKKLKGEKLSGYIGDFYDLDD